MATETFRYDGTSPCQIVVVNGKADGTQRISSALISLNGQQIVGPRDFNQQIGEIVRAVVLADQNQLSTTLRSKPGSFLTVSVECLAGTVPPTGGTVPQGSCLGSSSLSALVAGNNVTAYVPKGRWSNDTSDVSVVNVEGSSIAPTRIPTAPDAINSCASNPITGQTVCTANNNHADGREAFGPDEIDEQPIPDGRPHQDADGVEDDSTVHHLQVRRRGRM